MKLQEYPITKTCPYCNGDVILTTNDYIYGKTYGKHIYYYVCIKCLASVGTHPDNKSPLGRLANKELKRIKIKAHELFDLHWKKGNRKKRGLLYKALA